MPFERGAIVIPIANMNNKTTIQLNLYMTFRHRR
jgi:hypothetical protein